MIVEKMPTRIKEFYDFGKGELISKGDKTIIIHLFDICTTPDVCLVHQGLLEGAMKATNSRGKVEHTDCIHKDGEYCEFTITME
jgi:predicted hydrocarbon binding protein